MTTSWQPRQRRAVETRKRIHDAALAEMERVGVSEARVEDIVATAGVAWGSFYRYFRTKEDVLLEAAGTVAQVFAEACEVGVESGHPAGEVIIGAFWRAASAAPRALPLWEATFRALAERPERLGELLAQRRVPRPVDILAELIDAAQRRGEMRTDHSAAVLANVVVTSVWANAWREGPIGILGASPPARPGARSSRSVTVALLVDGLGCTDQLAPREPPVPRPERIGRHHRPDDAWTPTTAEGGDAPQAGWSGAPQAGWPDAPQAGWPDAPQAGWPGRTSRRA
jgi:AcrR family transcriptional regulator